MTSDRKQAEKVLAEIESFAQAHRVQAYPPSNILRVDHEEEMKRLERWAAALRSLLSETQEDAPTEAQRWEAWRRGMPGNYWYERAQELVKERESVNEAVRALTTRAVSAEDSNALLWEDIAAALNAVRYPDKDPQITYATVVRILKAAGPVKEGPADA